MKGKGVRVGSFVGRRGVGGEEEDVHGSEEEGENEGEDVEKLERVEEVFRVQEEVRRRDTYERVF